MKFEIFSLVEFHDIDLSPQLCYNNSRSSTILNGSVKGTNFYDYLLYRTQNRKQCQTSKNKIDRHCFISYCGRRRHLSIRQPKRVRFSLLGSRYRSQRKISAHQKSMLYCTARSIKFFLHFATPSNILIIVNR